MIVVSPLNFTPTSKAQAQTAPCEVRASSQAHAKTAQSKLLAKTIRQIMDTPK